MAGAVQIQELESFILAKKDGAVETPTPPGLIILKDRGNARIVTDKGTGLDVESVSLGLRIRSDKAMFLNTTEGPIKVESVMVSEQISSFKYDNVLFVGDTHVSIDGVLLSEILNQRLSK